MCLVLPLSAGAEPLAASAEPKRQKVDAIEVRGFEILHPHVAELIKQGESEMRAGKLEQAVELFRQAEREGPDGAVPPRRQCQALAALGRRDEAVLACERAVRKYGSGMDFRALVGALVSGPPTPTEMAKAMAMAARAREVMPNEPWGYAAQCDIARRLGDTEMFNACVEDLRRIAPEHYETKQVLAVAASLRHPWRLALGWGAIALACIATLVPTLRRFRRRAVRPGAVAAGLVIGALGGFAHAAYAAEREEPPEAEEPAREAGRMSQWPVNDKDPISSLPTVQQRDSNPLEFGYHMMDLGDRAAKATERGDHAAAVKYWLAMAKAVPDRHIAFAKACESYEALGEIDKAAYTCQAATARPGAQVKDYARYFKLVLKKHGTLQPKDIEDLDGVLAHLRGVEGGTVIIHALNCELGLRTSDAKRLEECTPALATSAPNDPLTVFSQWSLALIKKNNVEAERWVGVARTTGMSPDDVKRMEKMTWQASPFWQKILKRWPFTAVGLLLVAAGIGFAVYASRRWLAVPQPQG